MNPKKLIFFILALSCIAACKKAKIKKAAVYVGNYEIDFIHNSGLHIVYDSIGGIAALEERMVEGTDPFLQISAIDNTDSLEIEGLIKSLSGSYKETVKAIVEKDSLTIIFEESTQSIRNNFVRGKIWLESDSIFFDYRWNNSDIYNTEAIPSYGTVTAAGIKIN